MQKRLSDRDRLHAKIERLSENQIDQLLSLVRTMEKNRTDSPASEQADDELLDGLCAELETRRAVQVFEWESTRRRAESRGYPRAV
ncbi:MAG: hypothetical protein AB7H86_00450 [Blastocatellales bacterium]